MALGAYAVVIVFLAFGKRFVDAGPLWNPATTHVRAIRVVPFHELFVPGAGFAGSGDSIGNVAFFVPFGFLVFVLLAGRGGARGRGSRRRVVWRAVLLGFASSFAIEVLQYVLALGYSDVDDLICNTAGAAIGALCAAYAGPRLRRWVAAAIGVGSVAFVVLVLGVLLFGSGEIAVRR